MNRATRPTARVVLGKKKQNKKKRDISKISKISTPSFRKNPNRGIRRRSRSRSRRRSYGRRHMRQISNISVCMFLSVIEESSPIILLLPLLQFRFFSSSLALSCLSLCFFSLCVCVCVSLCFDFFLYLILLVFLVVVSSVSYRSFH